MNNTSNTYAKRIKKQLILWFVLLIIISVAGMGIVLSHRTERALQKNVQEIIDHLDNQLVYTIDFYFDGIRENAIQVFSEKDNYSYDPLTTTLDEYDRLQMESKIASSLSSMSFTENYLDFGIVYANNKMVGRISNGTRDSFGTEMYSRVEEMITGDDTHDGWCIGKEDDFKRIYYVKRLNEHAILVTSIYIVELEKVLASPKDMNLSIYLTDENLGILYSTVSVTDDLQLPVEIRDNLRTSINVSCMDEEAFWSARKTKNNWYLVSMASTEQIMRQSRENRHFMVFLAVVMIIATCVVSTLITNRISDNVLDRVNELDELAQKDQLSDLLNKESFRKLAVNYIINRRKRDIFAMVFLDIDNFKSINDTYGHTLGDEVIRDFARMIRAEFREEDLVGRIGGDEFGVFMRFSACNTQEAAKLAESCCERFLAALHGEYTSDADRPIITSSIGISIETAEKADFETLYKKADEALYRSKNKGKNCFTLYQEVEHA